MSRLIDLTGKKFGRLTVISWDVMKKKWLCVCDCGKQKYVYGDKLKRGNTKSCGCLKSDITAEKNYRHGLAGTRIYRIYYGILQRCLVETNPAYRLYGGRGITICDEWKNDFLSFYNWAVNNGYDDALTIDRIDPDGNYCPENCRWIPQSEQSANRRCCMMYNGTDMKNYCKKAGISYPMVYARINRFGYSAEDAIRIEKHNGPPITVDYSLMESLYRNKKNDIEISKEMGCNKSTVARWRRRNNLPANGKGGRKKKESRV